MVIKWSIFFSIMIIIILIIVIFLIFFNKNNFENSKLNEPCPDYKVPILCKEQCKKNYDPKSGMTYYSACLTYCSMGMHNKNKTKSCNYCKTCATERSGYNKACQYFSGPFIDSKSEYYNKKMPESWNPSPKCSFDN